MRVALSVAIASCLTKFMHSFFGPRLVVVVDDSNVCLGLQWAREEPLTHVHRSALGDVPSLIDGLRGYLRRHPYVVPTECAVGGQLQLAGDELRMRSRDEALPVQRLCRELALRRVLPLAERQGA